MGILAVLGLYKVHQRHAIRDLYFRRPSSESQLHYMDDLRSWFLASFVPHTICEQFRLLIQEISIHHAQCLRWAGGYEAGFAACVGVGKVEGGE